MVWSCLEDGFLVSHAIWQFMKFMGGRSGLRRILPSCTSIIEWCAEAGFPNCTDEMSHRRCKGQRIDSSSGWKFQMAPMAQPHLNPGCSLAGIHQSAAFRSMESRTSAAVLKRSPEPRSVPRAMRSPEPRSVPRAMSSASGLAIVP